MSLAELRGAVLAVDGIAAAEVASRHDRGPAVRVWLDGSREATIVSADVDRVLRSAGYRTDPELVGAQVEVDQRPAEATPGNGGARRAGLGRGLEALIPAPDPDAGPKPNRLEVIAVEESAAGSVVRAVDATGRSAIAPVEPGRSLNRAVAAAVADLMGFAVAPQICAVEVHQLGGVSVLVAVVEVDGVRASGSAVIDAGMPYTLGRALWFALRSLG